MASASANQLPPTPVAAATNADELPLEAGSALVEQAKSGNEIGPIAAAQLKNKGTWQPLIFYGGVDSENMGGRKASDWAVKTLALPR